MAKKSKKIFIVDDDPTHNDMLKAFLLEKFNMDILSFTSGEEAIRNIEQNPDFIILDYNLDRVNANALDGVAVLKKFREINPNAYVIMLSGQDKIEVAVDSMRCGAFDYVVKNPVGFLRIENTLLNISSALRDKKSLKAYRFATFFLGGFILFFIILAIVLKQLGIASDNMFWI